MIRVGPKTLPGLLLLALVAGLASAQTYVTPIEHVIIIVQENRSTDNLFQDPILISRGADIKKAKGAQPEPLSVCWDPGHAMGAFRKQTSYGACAPPVTYPPGCRPLKCAQTTYVHNTPTDRTIQPYWDLAEQYGFANYMFQTNEGSSFSAHQFLFSGTSAPVAYGDPSGLYRYFDAENPGRGYNANSGCIAPFAWLAKDIDPSSKESFAYRLPKPPHVRKGFPCYEHATLTDLLDSAGLSWRYYGYSLPNSLWNTPNAIYHICIPTGPGGSCQGAHWRDNSVDTHDWDIFGDLLVDCKLTAVSWVMPDGNYSDHPGHHHISGGPDWVAAIVNDVGNSKCRNKDGSSYWNSTAIFVTWDDWGGFYDHVAPWKILRETEKGDCEQWGCGFVYGFRVPLLVISAYTPAGYISGSPGQGGETPPYIHDFGSILNFSEYVFSGFGVAPGGIGPVEWPFDDYWAPDSYLSGNCSQSVCPYSLFDFFRFNAGQKPREFMPIRPQHFRDKDFVNLEAFGGIPEDPDMETP
jgi:hypothetical protein